MIVKNPKFEISDIEYKNARSIDEAYERGRKDQEEKDRETTIKGKIKHIKKRNNRISLAINIVWCVLIVITVVMLFFAILKGKISTENVVLKFLSENSIWVTVLGILINTLIGTVKAMLKKMNILTTDEKIIREKIEET